ncbi:hypothetical protein AGMMS50256_05950 [Betaproteobacteria bacterium]|nr:hypothetical protein AGMMS50256_05950 [Betaproteobacteria bacterium]
MDNKQRILCLATARAAPGMVLAKPVYDREGSILLTAETVLDSVMFEQLIRRGVEAISVSVPDPRDEKAIERDLDDVRARIDTIFRGTGSEARSQLRDTVLDYRIESTR